MLTGEELTTKLVELGVTDVVWLPDSALGPWEAAIEAEPRVRLIRVCREGEAWTLAAGLYIGGRQPLVVIQNTGLFESGDALRNAVHDLHLPLWGIIGYRSYLIANSTDSAKTFTEPVLKAWNLDYYLIAKPEHAGGWADHLRTCRAASKPGIVLLGEGRM